MPNKLSQFWQELKRRNVVRVITVYAGAAFVIIELINNITEPLRLPEWTPTLVIVLLAIGLPVAIIFSWIYDIHPEGGIVKTESPHKVKSEDMPKSSSSWKIASYISFVVIVGLIILNVIPRNGKKDILDKSIAVLPFIDDSPDKNNEHIINGIMEDLLINLQSIKALRVLGRTSTEQYRNNPKPIPEISDEMKVAYIIEGSGQRYGEKIRLRVQLLEGATGQHIWADSYDEVINGPEDIFRIQSSLAESIAKELQAVITPEEMDLIEKVSTTNLTAYDFYQKGREEFNKKVSSFIFYYSNVRVMLSGGFNKEEFEIAEDYFNEALKYDSTFAQAYIGLARIYWGYEGLSSENYLDTVRVLLDKALSFDPELAEAHTLYGRYYTSLNDNYSAEREVDKALSLNPNDWEAYSVKADISSDGINVISNRRKAVQLNRGPDELPNLLNQLANSYMGIGFFDKAADIFEEKLKLDRDSSSYRSGIAGVELYKGNFNRWVELLKQDLIPGSPQLPLNMMLFQGYLFNGDKEQALKYGKIWVDGMKASGTSYGNSLHRMGAYYALQGLVEEANYYYDLQIETILRQIEQGSGGINKYYDLASTYAVKGETDKAIENLRIWSSLTGTRLGMLWYLREDTNFNSMRDNPEFQQILNEEEAKFQAEHERVRQWLEENDML